MDSQIEKVMIKKKLNCAMLFGALYLICALWLGWWENITGNSLLLFIALIYAAYLILKLASVKKMIVANLIVLLLVMRLLLKYMPRLFLVGKPHYFIFYVLLIVLPLLHTFLFLSPFFKQRLIFGNEEIEKIDEIVKFRRIAPKRSILIFILFLLSLSALFANKIIKMPTVNNYLIQPKSIQFFLAGKSIVAKPNISIPGQDFYFGEYDFSFKDNEDKLLSVFLGMEYDLTSGIIFGRSFETTVGKGRFRVGKGEIINGHFKVNFLDGTKIILLTDVPQFEFGQKDMLLIKLPYTFEKLKL